MNADGFSSRLRCWLASKIYFKLEIRPCPRTNADQKPLLGHERALHGFVPTLMAASAAPKSSILSKI